MTAPSETAVSADTLPGKIVSGGQTGVDRAALDTAIRFNIPCGGWVPKGRRAEDGPIPSIYPVTETASSAYDVRTRKNIEDSDATLILTRHEPSGGTKLTLDIARELGRPYHIVDLNRTHSPLAALRWLEAKKPKILNVAGPRESTAGGIHAEATTFLTNLLQLAGAKVT